MSRIASLVCIGLALSPSAVARQHESEGVPRGVNLHGKELEIPFSLEGSRPIPIVEAKVNDKGPFKFYFDTGASGCVVDTQFATDLGLAMGPSMKVSDSTPTGGVDANPLVMDRLVIGAGEWTGVPAVAFDRTRFGALEGVKGVLGLPLARQHLLTIDYRGKRLRFSDEALPETGDGIAPFTSGELPRLEIVVAGKPVIAHIDTGSPAGISVPANVAKTLKWKSDPVVIGHARTVATEFEIRRGQLDGSIVIAGRKLQNPMVEFNDAIPTANLGYRFLQDWIFSIDQRNNRVRFVSAGPPLDSADAPTMHAPTGRRLGIRLDVGGEAVIVRGVDAGSLAEKIGLRDGDVLVSVNGRTLAAMDTTPLQDALKTNGAFEIAIRRDGKEQKIAVPAEPTHG